MGCYLETPAPTQKAVQLAQLYEATPVPEPLTLTAVPPGQVLICVVENPTFDAAAVCYDAEEFRSLKYDGTFRLRTWLLMDRDVVRTLVSARYRFLLD